MNAPDDKPRSLAAKVSWVSLGLALGCAAAFLALLVADRVSPLDRTGQGVLIGVLPRAALCALWAGEALAAVTGVGGLLLIRREDATSGSVFGVVARSLCGVAVGILGSILLWLVVGHVVVGF